MGSGGDFESSGVSELFGLRHDEIDGLAVNSLGARRAGLCLDSGMDLRGALPPTFSDPRIDRAIQLCVDIWSVRTSLLLFTCTARAYHSNLLLDQRVGLLVGHHTRA